MAIPYWLSFSVLAIFRFSGSLQLSPHVEANSVFVCPNINMEAATRGHCFLSEAYHLSYITNFFLLDFDSLMGAKVTLSQHCWPYNIRGFPVCWIVPVLGCPIFQDLCDHWLPALKETSLWRFFTHGGDEEQVTWWSHRVLASRLWSLTCGG